MDFYKYIKVNIFFQFIYTIIDDKVIKTGSVKLYQFKFPGEP